MSSNSRKKKSELSGTLQQWLEPRIRLKLKHKKNLTNEQARLDIIKDTCIKILSPLPLNVFASAINRLAQIGDTDRLYLIERLLTITPNPDMVSGERANDLREYLVATLSPSNVDAANGATTIEIEPNLMEVAKTVLQQSHRDWIGTREALSSFLKDCTSEFHSEKNVYIVYPHLSDISRKLFLEKEQRTGVEYFFSCIQNVANSMGYKFKDLIRTDVPSRDQDKVQKLMNEFFPKGIQLENDDINNSENNYKRRIRPPLLRPRWHNQQHMMLLALQNSPEYTLARGDLIDAAISLDEKLSAVTGLPRCFTGQTPRNSASACLTTNADKYFTVFKKDPSQHITYYKLSFIPNDRDDAIKHYDRWMEDIIEHDWPLCFGRPKKLSRTGQNVHNSGHVVMLSVGASNPLHLRCRRCVPEKSCDGKLPACSKCKSRGHLCIYPFRSGVQEKVERVKPKCSVTMPPPTNQNGEIDTRPATATRNKKKLQQQLLEQQKRLESGDPDACRAILPDEILNGLDLTNVPKSLDDVVEVRPSTIPNAGNGLFAKRNLPMATPLGFYFGVPMMEDEFDHFKDKVGKASHYSMRYKHTILDATDEKGEPFTDPNGPIFCPYHFMNEDPFGNMVFLEGSEVNQVICWTKRDIKKGEELFVYYGGDVDREHWGQAEENNEQAVCAGGDSEEDEIEFSEENDISSDDDERTINTYKKKNTKNIDNKVTERKRKTAPNKKQTSKRKTKRTRKAESESEMEISEGEEISEEVRDYDIDMYNTPSKTNNTSKTRKKANKKSIK